MFAVCLGCGLTLVVFLSYTLFTPLGGEPVTVTIESGMGVLDIARSLRQKRLIRSTTLFYGVVMIAWGPSSLKSGTYRIDPKESLAQIAYAIVRGSKKAEKEITIVEGWTIAEIGRYLDSQGIGRAEEFIEAARATEDLRSEHSFLKTLPPDVSLEGYLFPDSYRIFVDASARDIVEKMLSNFSVKVSGDVLLKISESGHSLHEMITLASIIEREVREPHDRRRVADIFLRRLQRGMPLQADSTVNYITGKRDPRATYFDIAIDSRFNTYRYAGLPPGPIAQPGLDSIRAASEPESNTYLFFLTTPGGKVIYSSTFEEHVSAKRRIYPSP